MRKPNIYKHENRTFEVVTICVGGLGGCMAETHVHEIIRPNWFIFRTRFIDNKTFWIDDYSSIIEGEKTMLARILQKEKEEKERRQKWAEFDN